MQTQAELAAWASQAMSSGLPLVDALNQASTEEERGVIKGVYQSGGTVAQTPGDLMQASSLFNNMSRPSVGPGQGIGATPPINPGATTVNTAPLPGSFGDPASQGGPLSVLFPELPGKTLMDRWQGGGADLARVPATGSGPEPAACQGWLLLSIGTVLPTATQHRPGAVPEGERGRRRGLVLL